MKINLKRIFNKKVAVGLGLTAAVIGPPTYEAMNSPWQAHLGTNVAQNKSGFLYSSKFVTTPREALSPMDIQRGESSDARDSQRLRDMNFNVAPDLGHWDHSIFGVKLYSLEDPKTQAGMTLKGANGEVIYQARYPRQVFKDFNDIPELWWRSLLNIENRELLDHQMDDKNVTVEIDRLGKAVFERLKKYAGLHSNGAGGSGLAVQIEKLLHESGGRTADEKAKLRQILTSMAKYYKDKDAKKIVVEYFNLVPLSATKLDGEITGMGEAVEIMFGIDFEKFKTVLKIPDNKLDAAGLKEKAQYYRVALALVGAVKMPDSYFNGPRKRGAHLDKDERRMLGHAELEKRINDIFLPELVKAKYHNIITPEFAALTKAQRLQFADQSIRHEPANPSPYKYVNNLRIKTQQTIKIGSLYDLDRRDITATVTAIPDLNRAAENICKLIQDPAYAKANGLVGGPEGKFLFDVRDLPYIKCAVIINSRSDDGHNLSRVLTDNDASSPLNLVSGGRQGMGSTSKYRWGLLPYETSMFTLYNKYHSQTPEQLRARLAQVNSNDNHTRWALNHLLDPEADNTTFDKFLDAALERTYSGNPGGTPVENFDRKENSWNVSVRKNFHNSVNAAFWRIMRDNVNFVIYEQMGTDQAMFDNTDDPRRAAFLERHTFTEGAVFLGRAMQEQTGKTEAETMDFLVKRSTARSPEQLAALFRYIYPQKSVAEMKTFILANIADKYRAKLEGKSSDKPVETPPVIIVKGKVKKIAAPKVRIDPFEALYKAFEPGHYDQAERTKIDKKTGASKTYAEVYDLNERRYKIFGNTMHPLALWLAKERIQHPDATYAQLEKAAEQPDGPSGKSIFRQSYGWLYAASKTIAQNRAIFGAIRYKAFNDYLGPQQNALGYPFKRVVPDERIVLGSNGDTPEALATLLGIIQNDGMMRKLDSFISINRFEDTDHAKPATMKTDPGHRAIPVEIAKSLRKELEGVVEEGTGTRLKYAFQIPNPNGPGKLVIPNGGKTGSDDGKLKGKGGNIVDVKSRTATWTFIIGDRVSGTVFLYVDGKPVQEPVSGNTPEAPVLAPTPGQPQLPPAVQKPIKTRTVNPAARAHFTSATAVITTKLLFATPEFQRFISQEFSGKAIEGALVLEDQVKVPARQAPAKPVIVVTPPVVANDSKTPIAKSSVVKAPAVGLH